MTQAEVLANYTIIKTRFGLYTSVHPDGTQMTTAPLVPPVRRAPWSPRTSISLACSSFTGQGLNCYIVGDAFVGKLANSMKASIPSTHVQHSAQLLLRSGLGGIFVLFGLIALPVKQPHPGLRDFCGHRFADPQELVDHLWEAHRFPAQIF